MNLTCCRYDIALNCLLGLNNNHSLPHSINSWRLYNAKSEPSWPWSYGGWIYNYLCNQCLSPLMLCFRILIRARCTTLCDKVFQWLATGRWFSPGPPVSSTNKTDRYDITEISLKVALNTIKQTNKPINAKVITFTINIPAQPVSKK